MRHLHVEYRVRLAAITVAAACVLTLPAGTARSQDRMVITTETKARRGLYPMAVPMPVTGDPALSQLVTQVQAFDLNVSSWFKVLDPKSFLADLRTEGMAIDPQRWKDVGAFGVIKTNVTVSGGTATIQFKLYEVEKGATPVLERQYSGPASEARKLVHQWCNEVVRHFTGEPGFFGSRMAFSNSKKVYVMDFDGNGVYSVTKNDAINLLPAMSPSGGEVAFTSYMRGNPDLYVVSSGGGRPRRVAKYNGMNTGAAWHPGGSKFAITLSRDGNAEIYVINASDGAILSRLTNNRYIDTSPAFSPGGDEIAFVSNREGSPQIFVMKADGSGQRRVSTIGNWNQTPAWSPKKGARVLAYTARDDTSSRFDIITHDLNTGKLTRITQNQGNNEEPTWSPDGNVLAFSSTRSSGRGIYLANADGTGEHHLVYRGTGTSVDWGPLPKQ
jgi:TolB protein